MRLASNLIMVTLLFTAPCFALNVQWPDSAPSGQEVKAGEWKYIYTDYDGRMVRCVGTIWVQNWTFGPPTSRVTTSCE